jgi:hypothetical protein
MVEHCKFCEGCNEKDGSPPCKTEEDVRIWATIGNGPDYCKEAVKYLQAPIDTSDHPFKSGDKVRCEAEVKANGVDGYGKLGEVYTVEAINTFRHPTSGRYIHRIKVVHGKDEWLHANRFELVDDVDLTDTSAYAEDPLYGSW